MIQQEEEAQLFFLGVAEGDFHHCQILLKDQQTRLSLSFSLPEVLGAMVLVTVMQVLESGRLFLARQPRNRMYLENRKNRKNPILKSRLNCVTGGEI